MEFSTTAACLDTDVSFESEFEWEPDYSAQGWLGPLQSDDSAHYELSQILNDITIDNY